MKTLETLKDADVISTYELANIKEELDSNRYDYTISKNKDVEKGFIHCIINISPITLRNGKTHPDNMIVFKVVQYPVNRKLLILI